MPLNTKKEIITLLSIFLSYSTLYSQNETTRQTPKANYRQAAKYSPKQLGKLVHSTSVRPHWLKNGNN